jgi:NADPH2:quinone reductase
MGSMVSFGQASGPIPPFDVAALGAKGSLFLTRPSLMTYTAEREDLLAHAADLMDVLERGAVKIAINQTYPLQEAARAHQDLEARKTTGKILLIP